MRIGQTAGSRKKWQVTSRYIALPAALSIQFAIGATPLTAGETTRISDPQSTSSSGLPAINDFRSGNKCVLFEHSQNVYVRNIVTGSLSSAVGNSQADVDADCSTQVMRNVGGTGPNFQNHAYWQDSSNSTSGYASRNSTTGILGNGASSLLSVDDSGRYVAFLSWADNLVANDNNGKRDVFVHDTNTGETVRASQNKLGVEANNHSLDPSMSRDGKYLIFSSSASNLLDGSGNTDTNSHQDIFRIDVPELFDSSTPLPAPELVSLDSAGLQGNGHSTYNAANEDGSIIAFSSTATNLVTGDTNNSQDIFVKNMVTGSVERANVDSAGNQALAPSYYPTINADGRYVAFQTHAPLVTSAPAISNIYRRDRTTQETTIVSVSSNGSFGDGGSYEADISADGNQIVFESESTNLVNNDTNGVTDIFMHDLAPPDKSMLVSPSGTGTSNPTYTWQAVSSATWYYLWVNDATGNPIRKWYTAAAAGCSGGTGQCSVTPSTTVSGTVTWWIRTWNSNGNGLWSSSLTFSAPLVPPSQAILIDPTGSGWTSTPTYTWNAAPTSTWYYLWVNDSTGTPVRKWYTAAQAGCSNGGVCTVTPATAVSGNALWWIRTWNTAGAGPWSAAKSFSIGNNLQSNNTTSARSTAPAESAGRDGPVE